MSLRVERNKGGGTVKVTVNDHGWFRVLDVVVSVVVLRVDWVRVFLQ